MNKNNHTLAHPGIFPGLIAVNISDAIVKKPRSLLIPSYFPCSPSGCKVPAMKNSRATCCWFYSFPATDLHTMSRQLEIALLVYLLLDLLGLKSFFPKPNLILASTCVSNSAAPTQVCALKGNDALSSIPSPLASRVLL